MAYEKVIDLEVGTQSTYSTISNDIIASPNASVYVTISDASADLAGTLTWYTGNGTGTLAVNAEDFEEATFNYDVDNVQARLIIQTPVRYWKATFVTTAGTGTAKIIARVEGR